MSLWLPEVAELVPRRMLMPGAAVYVASGNRMVDVARMGAPALVRAGTSSQIVHRGIPAISASSSFSASATLAGPQYGWPYTLFCVGYNAAASNNGSIIDLMENATGYRIALQHNAAGNNAPGGYAYFNQMFDQSAAFDDLQGTLQAGDLVALSVTMQRANSLSLYGSSSRLRPGFGMSYSQGACTAFYPDRVKVGDYAAQGILMAGFTPRRAWTEQEHLWFVNTLLERMETAHLATGMPALELSA